MKLLNVLSVTVFGVLFAVGCSSTDTGTSDGGPDTGTSSETGTDTGNPSETGTEETGTDAGDTCTPCLASHCAAEAAACQADTQCVSILNCVDACADAACRDACFSGDGTGVAKATDVVDCLDMHCSAECK